MWVGEIKLEKKVELNWWKETVWREKMGLRNFPLSYSFSLYTTFSSPSLLFTTFIFTLPPYRPQVMSHDMKKDGQLLFRFRSKYFPEDVTEELIQDITKVWERGGWGCMGDRRMGGCGGVEKFVKLGEVLLGAIYVTEEFVRW